MVGNVSAYVGIGNPRRSLSLPARIDLLNGSGLRFFRRGERRLSLRVPQGLVHILNVVIGAYPDAGSKGVVRPPTGSRLMPLMGTGAGEIRSWFVRHFTL